MSLLSRSSKSLLSPLLAVAVVVAALGLLDSRSDSSGTDTRASASGEDCVEPEASGADCADPKASDTPAAPVRVLRSDSVCPTAGYLCAGLRERPPMRVLRWADGTDQIHIRVPRPTGEPSSVGHDLQQAAARGIRVWDRSPFPIRVVLSDIAADEDFAITWSSAMGGARIGSAQTVWQQSEGAAGLRVGSFVLATRGPFDGSRGLDPESVMLTAAHEMRHALGLPHSDSERDVMYPSNTARYLSNRRLPDHGGPLLPRERGGGPRSGLTEVGSLFTL